MAIIPGSSINLGAHEPKKSAVINAVAVSATANEVALVFGAEIEPGKIQSMVGSLEVVLRELLNNLVDHEAAAGVVELSVPVGGGNARVGSGTPSGNGVGLSVGQTLCSKQQSHFIDRTFKRLIERMLEDSK